MSNDPHQRPASSQSRNQPSSPKYNSVKRTVQEYCRKWETHFFAKRQQFRRMTASQRQWEINVVGDMQKAYPQQKRLERLLERLKYENELIQQLSGQQVTCGKICCSQWKKLTLCDSHAILLMIVASLVALFLIFYLVNGGTATFELFSPQGFGNRIPGDTAENGTGDTFAGNGTGGTTAGLGNGGTNTSNTTDTTARNSTGTLARKGNLTCNLSDQLSLMKVASTGSLQAIVNCSISTDGWIRIVVATKNASQWIRDIIFSFTTLIYAVIVVLLYFFGPFLFKKIQDWCAGIFGMSDQQLKQDLNDIISSGQETISANGMMGQLVFEVQ